MTLLSFILLFAAAAAVKRGRRGDRGFARSSTQTTETPSLWLGELPVLEQTTGPIAVVPPALNDEQADMIAEIGQLRVVLDEACAPDPTVAGEAACQTEPSGLLGLQLAQLHDLEVGTSSASSWEADSVIDAGVLAALTRQELREHHEMLRMRCNDRSA